MNPGPHYFLPDTGAVCLLPAIVYVTAAVTIIVALITFFAWRLD